MFREAASPLEKVGGWIRITKYYDGSCADGVSQYVKKGNKACTKANGFDHEQFAEWVQASKLSSVRPPDPALSASVSESIISGSDDFAQYRKAFLKAAQTLIAQGKCKPSDLSQNGGWTKSVTMYPDRPAYFTYCNGEEKFYMDANTGSIL